MKQLEFWEEEPEPPDTTLGNSIAETRNDAELLLQNEAKYASVKRIHLVYEKPLTGRPRLTSTSEAIAFFKQYWKDCPANDQERFVIATCNTKHVVQSVVEITVGTLDASLIHPREVFRPAILESAAAIVLSHNHPSGDPTPSREDRKVTDQLTEAGKLLGITVLDHIVHGDASGEVVSIRESGV